MSARVGRDTVGLDLVEAVCAAAGPVALATIIEVRGSSPRHPGSKLLLGAPGGALGTVGGGQGEARALEACRRGLAGGGCELLSVEMVGTDLASPAMVCGGSNLMLIEALADPAPYREARARLARGERVLWVKRIQGGPGPVAVSATLCGQDGAPICGSGDGLRPEAAARALATGQAAYDPEAQVFYDPVMPEEKLLILGGGHVGQALAALAPALGFAVTVADDRPEFTADGRFPPGVRTLLAGFEQAVAGFPFDSATYAVVLSRGHRSDLECVRAVLRREYRYAGFMGSARKTRLILDQALQDGFDPAKVAALWAPIGLDIGAETPAELAVAILAELVAVRRNAAVLPGLAQARAARRA